jgi:hypothetical protein
MEILYVVLIIVAIFIALVAVAIIAGTSVVRRNRRLNKLLQQQPSIPDIVNFTNPGIVPALEAVNSIVLPDVPTIQVSDINDLNKYYVTGKDLFVNVFNYRLREDVRNKLRNQGYTEITFSDLIKQIISDTFDGIRYTGGDSNLDSNPFERLLRIWKKDQPLHSGSIEYERFGKMECYLELDTIRDGKIWDKVFITIIYTPTLLNNKNVNILRYRVAYIDREDNKADEIEYYNIDNLDQMIADMNAKMPLL